MLNWAAWVLLAVASMSYLAGSALATPTLKFNASGEFKILFFADMHYGEREAPDTDSNSDQVTLRCPSGLQQ